jgi:hypothetical protein
MDPSKGRTIMRRITPLLIVLCLIATSFAADKKDVAKDEEGFVSLFDGKTSTAGPHRTPRWPTPSRSRTAPS